MANVRSRPGPTDMVLPDSGALLPDRAASGAWDTGFKPTASERGQNLTSAAHENFWVTTTRRDKDARPAPDLVDRNFVALRPNQLWVADITYVPTASGVLYLAVVLDA